MLKKKIKIIIKFTMTGKDKHSIILDCEDYEQAELYINHLHDEINNDFARFLKIADNIIIPVKNILHVFIK